MKKLVALLLAMTMVFCLVSCASSDAPAAAPADAAAPAGAAAPAASSGDAAAPAAAPAEGSKELKPLVASGQPYSHTLPAWLGEQDGKFEEIGMDFEILMFTGGAPQNEALGADEWDVGTMGSPPSITSGKAYGAHVIAFGSPDTQAVTIWARPDSDIAQIKGEVDGYPDIYGNADAWRGKTILCPITTSAHFTLIATLKALGLTSDDVEIIDMGVPQAFTAFKAGEGDIACLWDPQGFNAEEEDWVCVSSGAASKEVMPTVVVASEKAMAEKHDEILAYLDIYLQESETYSKDIDAYGKAMYDIGVENGLDQSAEVAKRCAEKRPLQTLDSEIELFKGEYGSREADKLMENLMDFFVYTGTIEESEKEGLIANGFVDGTFIEELAAKYGKTVN